MNQKGPPLFPAEALSNSISGEKLLINQYFFSFY